MDPDNIIKERAIGYVEIMELKFSKGAIVKADYDGIREKIKTADLALLPHKEAVKLFVDWIKPLPGTNVTELEYLLNT